MPVDPVSNAPTTSIIAYNADSPRGWNDPPTFAFSGQKGGGSRPKLDLRKRVSHHQALHGTKVPPNSPSTTPTTSSFSGGNEVSNRMGSLTLQPSSPTNPRNTSSHQHSTTPPLHSKAIHTPNTTAPTVPLYTPPTTTSYVSHDRSNSLPSILMPNLSPVPPGIPIVSSSGSLNIGLTPDAVKSSSPVPVSDAPTHLGQPLFHLKEHSFEPVKTHNESGVRSTADLGDHLDDHVNGSPDPQIFHPRPYPVPNALQTSVPTDITPSQGFNSAPVGHVSSHPPSSITPPLNPGHFTPPISNPPNRLHVGHITPPPPPPVTASISPFSASHRTPTPTKPPTLAVHASGSLSTGSTPRCLSPEENGVDDGSSEMSDEEGLKATMDALNDVIQKYHIKKHSSADIIKKLQVMSNMWMDGKLGKTVKTKMLKLAKALDDGNGEEAHHIHVSIIVDHVTEVNQWIVAVKRLISLVRHQPEKAASS